MSDFDDNAEQQASGPSVEVEDSEAVELVCEIRAQIAQRVTFASYQCDVPVIADLVISNPFDYPLEELTLHLSCEPHLLGERTWTIDRIAPESELHLRDRRVTIAGGLLDSLNERSRGEVTLELRQADRVLASFHHRLVALARNEWGGSQYMPELLAAFVMPNDSAVQRLLKESSRILESSGKQGSLEGYQSKSRKRSWEIVSGIWAAVSCRNLTYAEPPASFGRSGQKIRFPSMIEEHGLATCLDTALLFAAAIEQAGLYPIIVFTEGHALTGAWLQPQSLPSLTVDDPMEIRKAIAQQELVLFETTMATTGHALPFSRAVSEGRRQVAEENESRFIYAIDIRQARSRDIQPLSSSVAPTVAVAGKDDTVGGAPPLDEAPDLPPFEEPQLEEEVSAEVSPEERLERWKRSLLDLSKRNRLLNLKASNTAIPIFCPTPDQLEDKLAEGKKIKIITPPEKTASDGQVDRELYHLRTGEDFAEKFAAEALSRNEIVANVDVRSLEKGSIELYRKAKADFAEGGSNTLFLALGMLRWAPKDDSRNKYRAPLILMPVKIERASAASRPYLTRHEDDTVFNLTLLQMLHQDFQIDIPGLQGELVADDSGVDVRKVWDIVRAKVRDVPGFEVVEEVVLSTFSFAKYLMWKDLSERTQSLKNAPFVKHVIDHPREPYEHGATFISPRDIDQRVDPAEVLAPLNADASQIVAIHASGGDGDFVLEGPPGTGKSETIANIIAHNLGQGRRVLFVSEKMAALDVVYRRLSACGLGDFCLELHSAKANKRAVLDQLGAAWENRDALSSEEWKQKAEQLGAIRSELNELVTSLHEPGPAGISPRAAIGRAVRYGDVHRLRLDWERDAQGIGYAATPSELSRLEDISKRLAQQYEVLTPEDVEAFGGITHTEWSFAWAGELVAAAAGLKAASGDLRTCYELFARRFGVEATRDDPDEYAALADVAALVPDCADQNFGFVLSADGREALQTLESLDNLLGKFRSQREQVAVGYVDERIAGQPYENWSAQLEAAKGKIWPFSTLAVRALRKEMVVQLGLSAGGGVDPTRDIAALQSLSDLQGEMDRLSGLLPGGTPWQGLQTEPDRLVHAIGTGHRLCKVVARLAGFGHDYVELRTRIVRILSDGRDTLAPGMPVATAAEEFMNAYARFDADRKGYCSLAGSDEAGVVTQLADLERQCSMIIERERRLNNWCQWIAVCREARQHGLASMIEALEQGSISADCTVEALRTAYACWVAPILIDSRPALTRFSAVRHDDLIRTFRELDKEVAELTSSYIRARLSSGIPHRESGTADAGYGVLSRELQKKARHKPVRQLMTEMGDSLTTLTPCLMMSPLSVAQFLPTDKVFDLVVFDEASQITVPDAVGAIARGRRSIVVGDPRQMPPTNFFSRGAEDSDNEEVRDLESILDEALAARVPHHRLTGHYRSRHESLISFSNHAYYGSQLVTYPSADTTESAVSFRRIDGVYAKGKSRTNEIEARAVVKEVVDRLRNPVTRHHSIGVVTLNSEQQRLIEDLLDQERRSDPELEPFFNEGSEEPVFVKNLETVQGDQRDVILLSVGYGPTEPGARTMSMNFGPLNRQGGERRLNVAITRATTEVVVFASFDAAMIDLTRTSSEAVKDLKNYIDFAARGPVALGEAIHSMGGDHAYDSDFEMAVAERLRSFGWSVRTQIGVSKFKVDLGVVHPDFPGKFLAGIECDGASYHSSPAARDRDRVRHIILENLGWRLLRVWSTDFFQDPEGACAILNAKLNDILEADRAASEELERIDDTSCSSGKEGLIAVDRTEEETETSEKLDESEGMGDERTVEELEPEYQRVAGLASTGVLDDLGDHHESSSSLALDPERFHAPDYQPVLQEMAFAMIDHEGPITFKRLSERIARAHGFQRTGRQIRQTIWNAIDKFRANQETPDEETVFWPEGVAPLRMIEFRGSKVGQDIREWRDIPHPEKLGLISDVLRDIGPEESDALEREVARRIGAGRLTAQLRSEIRTLTADFEDI